MKKRRLWIPLMAVLFMAGCKTAKENSAPVIEGVSSIECVVNSRVDLLEGVVAYDAEDGDITADMAISIAPEVAVSDGYAVFDRAGNYKITYRVEDSAGGSAVKAADIAVIDRETYLDFRTVNGFYTAVSGHAVMLAGGMHNGVYSIAASGCEVAEDVALQRVFSLESGYEYTFRYFLESETAGRIRVLVDGNIAAEQRIDTGDNTVVFTYRAENTAATVSLLLGALGDSINCRFKGAEVSRPQEVGWQELSEGFTVLGRFDGTQGNAYLTADKEEGVLEITQTASDMWRGGMFLNTNIEMQSGREYIVSFDLKRTNPEVCEVSLQNRQWDETKYTQVYISAENTETRYECRFTVTEETKGALWIYVQSGTAVNEIRFSGLSVKTYTEGTLTEALELSDFKNYNEGYSCALETFEGGFLYRIEAFADTDYRQRVASPEFLLSGSGKNFMISFKAKASKPVEAVFAAPVADGWDPTWVWSKITLSEEEQIFTFFGSEASEDGNILVWQFGSAKNQRYSNVEIKIRDIKICYKNSEYDGE